MNKELKQQAIEDMEREYNYGIHHHTLNQKGRRKLLESILTLPSVAAYHREQVLGELNELLELSEKVEEPAIKVKMKNILFALSEKQG